MWDLIKDHAERNNYPKSTNPDVQHIYNRPVTLKDVDYHLNTVRLFCYLCCLWVLVSVQKFVQVRSTRNSLSKLFLH